MYIVEIRQDGDGLVGLMADIRTWLDHRHIQPSVFLLGTGFLLETSRKPLKPIRERAKLIGAAQIVP